MKCHLIGTRIDFCSLIFFLISDPTLIVLESLRICNSLIYIAVSGICLTRAGVDYYPGQYIWFLTPEVYSGLRSGRMFFFIGQYFVG